MGTRSPLQLRLVSESQLDKFCHEEPVSRRSAVQSLAERVADQWTFADEDLLLLYLDCFADPISEIRRVAAEVATQLPREPRIVERLKSLLQDEDEEVRAQAVIALGRKAEQGSRETIASISCCLVDSDWHTRHAAIQALGALALPYDSTTHDVVRGALSDRNWHVRQVAVETLGYMLGAQAPRVLAEATKDWHVEVRRAAVTTIASVAAPGDSHAVVALCSALEQEDSLVLRGAINGLGRLAEEGDSLVLAKLQECHSRASCDSVKEAARDALSTLTS
jgi:HEAT repeat protein